MGFGSLLSQPLIREILINFDKGQDGRMSITNNVDTIISCGQF